MMRRAVMWVAGAVVALSLAAWGVSMFRVIWLQRGGDGIDLMLWGGEASIDNMGAYAAPGWTIYGFDGWRQRWWPHRDHGFLFHVHYPGQDRFWKVTVPLWMPATAGAMVAGGCWGVGRRRRLRPRDERCRGCGYSLSGLPDGVGCPECGRAAPGGRPRPERESPG